MRKENRNWYGYYLAEKEKNKQLQHENEKLKAYKAFYRHIRDKLDTVPVRDGDHLEIACSLCDKTFEQITGVAEQALDAEPEPECKGLPDIIED